MRAVSLRQPWPWLIAHGHVGLANFDWATDYRGQLLIRAGQKLVQRDYRALAAKLLDELQVEVPPFDDVARVPRGGIVGLATVAAVSGPHPSPLFTGPYVWTFQGARPLPFTPFKPPHAGPDLRWFDVPRAAVGLPTPSTEEAFA